MDKNNLDMVILTSMHNIAYYTGFIYCSFGRPYGCIVTKSKSRDVKQQKKFNAMVQTLIDNYGYNEDSAEEVIKFASNNLWRDS